MRLILCLMFGIMTGVVSAHFGITPSKTFWLWLFTNVPLIILVTILIHHVIDEN